jgi:DprA winged helix domain
MAQRVAKDLADRGKFGIGENLSYELLSLDEARHVDEQVKLFGRSSSEALAVLFDLELKGMVRQLPG